MLVTPQILLSIVLLAGWTNVFYFIQVELTSLSIPKKKKQKSCLNFEEHTIACITVCERLLFLDQ